MAYDRYSNVPSEMIKIPSASSAGTPTFQRKEENGNTTYWKMRSDLGTMSAMEQDELVQVGVTPGNISATGR